MSDNPCEVCGSTFPTPFKLRRHQPVHDRPDLEERFWSKVAIPRDVLTGCWEWRGALHSAGYGQVSIKNRPHYAHRVAFEWVKGPVPSGMALDHLCRVRHCVNPTHLEPVTDAENSRRGARAKLTLAAVDEMRRLYRQGVRQQDIADRFGVHGSQVSLAIGGKAWGRDNQRLGRAATRGERSGTAKLTELQVREIRARAATGEYQRPLAKAFGVTQGVVWHIIHRRTWRHV